MSTDAERIARLLQDIASEGAKLAPTARANLRRDLEGVSQRLAADAYAETDFIIRDPFDVQRRTHEFLTYVAGWRAQAERLASLLERSHIAEAASVLELCPGWAPKTLMALAQLDYRGAVTVVDNSEEALAALMGFSRALQPRLRVTTVRQDVLENDSPAKAELVIANHILDDLLLDRWSRVSGRGMQELYEDPTLLRQAWSGIAADRQAIETTFLPRLAGALGSYTTKSLLITHYPSNVERALDATDVSRLFAELFTTLRDLLVRSGFDDTPGLLAPGIQAYLLVR